MYEITFITKEEKDRTVKDAIEALGGKIVLENLMGRKKFAYKIKKEDAGFFISYIFELDPEKVNKLTANLKLKSQVLRYLIVSKKSVAPRPAKEKIKIAKEAIPATEKVPVEKIEVKEKDTTDAKKEVTKHPEKVKEQVSEKTLKPIVEVIKTEKAKTPVKEKSQVMPKETKPAKEEKAALPKLPEKESMPDEKERLKALEDKLEEILKD